jgi:hypothetical protein
MILHLLTQPLGERDRGIEHRAGKNQQEFLAAITSDPVDLARFILEKAREFLEHVISREMAVGVVHALELVDVAHHERNRLVQTNRVAPYFLEPLLE